MDKKDFSTDSISTHDIRYQILTKIAEYSNNKIDETQLNLFIDTYLSLIGMNLQNQQLISQICYSIRLQGDFVTLNSVSAAFKDWGIPNEIAKFNKETILESHCSTLGMLINPLELIIILNLNKTGIIYFSSKGKLNHKKWMHLENRWTGQYLVLDAIPISKIRFNRSSENPPAPLLEQANFETKHIDLISKTFKQRMGIYSIFGMLISPVIQFLYKAGISPNILTLIWIICSFLAAGVVTFQTTVGVRILAIVLILCSYILDCCDGALARLTKKESTFGEYIDRLGHWLVQPIFIVSVVICCTQAEPSINIAWWGLACVVANATFNQLYAEYIVRYSEERATKILWYLYPINPNIFIIGLASNRLYLALQLLTLTMTTFIIVIIIIELAKFHTEQKARKKVYKNYFTASTEHKQ
ncbi:MAG: CDP-alcohol phosphatidyltransferase family protein [Chitinophaga sp.]|uniref:CDP-alcohol phosphatidyltransferase family protein n=1 Tax=Chitinophaga sp. TaxID=1869181 RepID=UPI0025BA4058|nr:CDP-alcohol phosphatidyltransferase family protein [Chitinophaga sp.]MBV8253615.1 CDP-alcohol phosphatidyltransferase family protein [Chitinophaga sp.]